MPGGVVILVELSLDVRCSVLAFLKVLEGFLGYCDGLFLHLLRHIRLLDNRSHLHLFLSELATVSKFKFLLQNLESKYNLYCDIIFVHSPHLQSFL